MIAVLAAALVQATPNEGAAQDRAPQGACIDAVQQPDWAPIDDHTILVTSGVRRFKVVTDTCPPLHRAFPTITTELLGGSQVCTPQDVRLHVSSGGDVASIYCSIVSITPLSATQAKPLGAKPR